LLLLLSDNYSFPMSSGAENIDVQESTTSDLTIDDSVKVRSPFMHYTNPR